MAGLELMKGSHGGSPERGKRGKGKGRRQGVARGVARGVAWGAPWGGGGRNCWMALAFMAAPAARAEREFCL
jgi:hypothetical protein